MPLGIPIWPFEEEPAPDIEVDGLEDMTIYWRWVQDDNEERQNKPSDLLAMIRYR